MGNFVGLAITGIFVWCFIYFTTKLACKNAMKEEYEEYSKKLMVCKKEDSNKEAIECNTKGNQ